MPFYSFVITRKHFGSERHFAGLVYAEAEEEAEDTLRGAFSESGHPLESIVNIGVARAGITRDMRDNQGDWRVPKILSVY